MEFCGGGDLGHYLRRYGRVPEASARYLMQQLAEGLKMLRMNNVIHVCVCSYADVRVAICTYLSRLAARYKGMLARYDS